MHRLDSCLSAFAYRVRSQTDSFLKNLLTSSAINSKTIKQQKWFKSVYEEDITIKSMMDALDIIDSINGTFSNLNSANILSKVFFWYFDVDKTSQGEELYITMNSRGEKLTDSEQIKPRLLNKVENANQKEKYGKEWDNWEEFFYRIRNNRKTESIDTAMNNVLRLVLEMVTCGEHDKIKPIEDAESISLDDVEKYMKSIEKLYDISGRRYCAEIERLYGDKDGDGNFIVLKALLTETLKKQNDLQENDLQEFERIYQIIINHVRRNKIKNVDFLQFLKEYSTFNGTFYDFILSNSEKARQVVNGHELDKVRICSSAKDFEKEKNIWEEQSIEFWNGEIKNLITWSKGDDGFSFEEFNRIRKNFHKLFKSKYEKEDWTSDKVRQALIASRFPEYPLGGWLFGYNPSEWKEIFDKNSKEFLAFLNRLDSISIEDVPSFLDSIRKKNEENSKNQWAEFVKYDSFLEYCNTKHLYWSDKYGWLLVRNSWARPFSVRNMRMFNDLKEKYGENINGWDMWKFIAWDSCVCIQNNTLKVYTDIRVMRKENDIYYFKVDLSKRDVPSENYSLLKEELLSYIPRNITMEWNEMTGSYVWFPSSIEEIHSFINSLTNCSTKRNF